MVVAAVAICLFPARFADLFVRGPFVTGFELLSSSLALLLSDDARNNVAVSSVAVTVLAEGWRGLGHTLLRGLLHPSAIKES